MMTDLASLLSALTAQPGIAAQVSVGDGLASAASSSVLALHSGAAGTAIAAVTPGKLPSTPATTTAAAFQAVLAAQSPVDPSVPIDPVIVGSYATASPAPNPVGQSNLPVAPAQSPASADRLTLAPVSAQQPIAKPATPGRSMPVTAAVAAAEPPAPAAPQLQLPASTREVAVDRATPVIPTKPPATISVMPDADGKLPKVGNFLPVLRIPTAPGVAAQPGVVIAAQNSSDDSRDDKPAITSDPSRQPLFAPAVLVAQPLPPVMVRDATGRTTLPSTAATPMSAGPTPAATTVPAAVATAAPSPTAPGVSGARPIVFATATSPAAPPVIPAAQTSAPATSIPPSPTTVTVPVALLAQATPVAPAQSAPDTGTNSAAVPLPAAAVAPAAPAIANIAAVGQLPASPLLTGPSTASRLARQAGGPQSAKGDAPTDDAAAALAPAVAVPPAAATPASASTNASSPAATPPPDFAALVDRLLEARATAQSATPPQQISTSVTHSDFGKVSLTFRQDPAGLSVSMTSTDPGFARAAQSAMASSGQAGVGQNVTADQLSIGHAGDQNPAGNQNPTGNIGQSFSQPDAPAAVNPAATGQSASFSPAGGGSQQSQSQAQAQPQQRPGFIAANRSPAASDRGSNAAAAKGAGIFA